MTSDSPRTDARLRLSHWLAAALLLFAAAFAAVLIVWIGPRTEAAMREHGTQLMEQSSAAARSIAAAQTQTTGALLEDLIEHGARVRQRTLSDLPLELFGGDVEAIRRAIGAEDARRSAQQQQNVAVLAREMQDRAERRIQQKFDELVAVQNVLLRNVASDLRITHLALTGSALALLLVVLGIGLSRLVVLPTRALRAATRRVADGQLDTDVPRPAGTELGDLTRDFGRMVDELRRSRQQLQHQSENLEHEVARKTAELRQSHKKLAETERLAALGTLAGGIAHEFHNVIGGIRGCTQELSKDERDADRQETMQVILRAADRASGIVQQLTRFARRTVEQRAEVEPLQVVEDALRLCEPAARRQNVTVERELAAIEPFVGDADGLHQIVVNLLLNAVQAMPDGGTLHVTLRDSGDMVTIRVADTGVGIAEADLAHVFEPFFTTRKDPDQAGTGLGLSVSYGLATAHGGRITVESTLGEGAVFTVELPRVAPTGD